MSDSPSPWTSIIEKIETEHPPYGNITLELVFHDGRLSHYFINRSERHNIDQHHEQKK